MATKVVSANQIGKQIVYNATDDKLEVNIDGITLVVDTATGKLSVDASQLNVTVVSADADNAITVGSDNGAFLSNDTIKTVVGEMVAALDDGIDYDALTKTLTTVLKSFAVTDTGSLDLTLVDTNGDLALSGEIRYSNDVGNIAVNGSDGGLFVPVTDTEISYSIDVIVPNIVITVGAYDTAIPLEETQDLSGNTIGYLIR